jgi:hypothetical protein
MTLHRIRVVQVQGVCYARWMCRLVAIALAFSLASGACGRSAVGPCQCGANTTSNRDSLAVASSNRDSLAVASSNRDSLAVASSNRDSLAVASSNRDSLAVTPSDFVGTWNGDWGTLLLRRDGDRLLGAYSTMGGTIVGRIDGGILRGFWSEPPRTGPEHIGQLEFRLFRKDGVLRLDGRYRIGANEDWHENWDLTKLDGPPPPELEIEFTKPDNFVEGPR